MVCLNSRILPESEAFINVKDPGFLFGLGVFTTIRMEEGKLESFDEHLRRLKEHCDYFNLPEINLDKFSELIMKNNALSGISRVKLIRTLENSLITMEPYVLNKKTITLTHYPYPVLSPLSGIKSLSYADRFFVKNYANKKGFDDAITVCPEGYLTETAFSNLLWFSKGICYTPSNELPLLYGITLKTIERSYEIVQIKTKKIPSDSHIFICNSMHHILPVVQIDDNKYERDQSLEKDLKSKFLNCQIRIPAVSITSMKKIIPSKGI